jgi:lambda repressor-like predicted transcriptional regulator
MRYYGEISLSPYQTDKMIVELRQRGLSYRAIGRRVGMSGNGVMLALRRLQAGGRGTRARS